MLSDVCLSDVWHLSRTSGLSRSRRPRKIKIGTKVAHVSFKAKRSRSPGRFTHRRVNASNSCSGARRNVLAVETTATLRSARRREALWHPQREERGRRHIGATARLQLVELGRRGAECKPGQIVCCPSVAEQY